MSADTDIEGINRRRYLTVLSLAAAGGLAGCPSDGGETDEPTDAGDGSGTGDPSGSDGSDGGSGTDTQETTADLGEPGEQVPTIEVEYWANNASTPLAEASIPRFAEHLQEIGIDINATPVNFSEQITHNFEDQRTHHISQWHHGASPDRLDPNEFTWRYNLFWAGANGAGNPNNYANCEHTQSAYNAVRAPSEEERRELVNEAQGIMSEDIVTIPLCTIIRYGAYRNDLIEPGGLGLPGVTDSSPTFLIESRATTDQSMRVNVPPGQAETKVHPAHWNDNVLLRWNNLVYSPLVGYDEEFELENVLAESYETSDDGLTYTFALRSDASFHNGDPVTATDVKWTLEHLEANAGAYPGVSSLPYDSITAVDDTTVEVTLTEPYPGFLTQHIPLWGILPRDIWVESGAEENPREFDLDPIVGSGPYQVDSFVQGEGVFLTPYPDHPVYQPESDLVLQVFADDGAAYTSFQEGELTFYTTGSMGIIQEIRNQMDAGTVTRYPTFMASIWYPAMNFGPTMHEELRAAISWAIDRSEMNQVALYGDSSPVYHSCPWTENHPYYPGEDNLRQVGEATAQPEQAIQILEENGWQIQNGNLHYPQDIDLDPQWPAGEEPQNFPDVFPCVDEIDV